MKTVVLGAIEMKRRTHRAGLRVFLASLRAVAPHVNIVLFNSSPDDGELHWLLQRFRVQSINALDFDRVYGISYAGVAATRFLEYRAWLYNNDFDRVVLADTLDVLWQASPEELHVVCGLTVSRENKIIGDCPFNSRWMREFYPDQSFAEHEVICCGVIYGPQKNVLDYLDTYAADVVTRTSLRRGYDTAVLAHYAYQQPATHVQILPYRNEQVMHLGYADPQTVVWRDKQLHCVDAVPIIAHQYNRHPEAMAQIEAAWT